MNKKMALESALRLFKDGKGWTKGSYARDSHGLTISEIDEHACQWCTIGAIRAVSQFANEPLLFADTLYDLAAALNAPRSDAFLEVVNFNDRAMHFSEIKELFLKAIERCGE
jgi:hypothetical protein